MSYVSRGDKVFDVQNPQNGTCFPEIKRSDHRLKSFYSTSDKRAWHYCEGVRYQHFYELVSKSQSCISTPTCHKYVPLDQLIKIFTDERDIKIKELELELKKCCTNNKADKSKPRELNTSGDAAQELIQSRETLRQAMHKLQNIDEIINENKRLHCKLRCSEEKIKYLEEKKKRLENELADVRSKSQVQMELKKAQEMLCQVTQQENVNGTNANEGSSERERLLNKIENLEKELEQSKKKEYEIEMLKKQFRSDSASLEEISKENECYKKKLASMKCLEKQIQEIKKQGFALANKYKKESQKATEQMKKICNVTKEVKTLRDEKERLQKKVEELATHEQQYKALQSKLKRVEAVIAENELLNNKLVALDKLEKENEYLRCRLDQIQEMEMNAIEDKERIVELQCAVADQEEEMKDLLCQIERLTSGRAEEELERLKCELFETNSKLKFYEQQLADIPMLEAEIDELRKKLCCCCKEFEEKKASRHGFQRIEVRFPSKSVGICAKYKRERQRTSSVLGSSDGKKANFEQTQSKECQETFTKDEKDLESSIALGSFPENKAMSCQEVQDLLKSSKGIISCVLEDMMEHNKEMEELEIRSRAMKNEIEILKAKLESSESNELRRQIESLNKLMKDKDAEICELKKNCQNATDFEILKDLNNELKNELKAASAKLKQVANLESLLQLERQARCKAEKLLKEKRGSKSSGGGIREEDPEFDCCKSLQKEINDLKLQILELNKLTNELKKENELLRELQQPCPDFSKELDEKCALENLLSLLQAELDTFKGQKLSDECEALRSELKRVLEQNCQLKNLVNCYRQRLNLEKKGNAMIELAKKGQATVEEDIRKKLIQEKGFADEEPIFYDEYGQIISVESKKKKLLTSADHDKEVSMLPPGTKGMPTTGVTGFEEVKTFWRPGSQEIPSSVGLTGLIRPGSKGEPTSEVIGSEEMEILWPPGSEGTTQKKGLPGSKGVATFGPEFKGVTTTSEVMDSKEIETLWPPESEGVATSGPPGFKGMLTPGATRPEGAEMSELSEFQKPPLGLLKSEKETTSEPSAFQGIPTGARLTGLEGVTTSRAPDSKGTSMPGGTGPEGVTTSWAPESKGTPTPGGTGPKGITTSWAPESKGTPTPGGTGPEDTEPSWPSEYQGAPPKVKSPKLEGAITSGPEFKSGMVLGTTDSTEVKAIGPPGSQKLQPKLGLPGSEGVTTTGLLESKDMPTPKATDIEKAEKLGLPGFQAAPPGLLESGKDTTSGPLGSKGTPTSLGADVYTSAPQPKLEVVSTPGPPGTQGMPPPMGLEAFKDISPQEPTSSSPPTALSTSPPEKDLLSEIDRLNRLLGAKEKLLKDQELHFNDMLKARDDDMKKLQDNLSKVIEENKVLRVEGKTKEAAGLEQDECEKRLRDMERENQEKLKKIMDQHQKEMNNREKTYNDNLNAMKAGYETDIRKMAERHKASIMRLQALHEDEVKELNTSHEIQMETMQTQSEMAMKDIARGSAVKLRKLAQQHEKEMQNAENKINQLQSSLKKSSEELEYLRNDDGSEKLFEMKEKHLREMQKMKKSSMRRLSIVASRYEGLLADEKRRSEAQVDILKKSLKEKMERERGDGVCDCKFVKRKSFRQKDPTCPLDFNETLEKILEQGLESLSFNEIALIHRKSCCALKEIVLKSKVCSVLEPPVGEGCPEVPLLQADKEQLLQRIIVLENEIIVKQRQTQEAILNMEVTIKKERCRLEELKSILENEQKKNLELKHLLTSQTKLQSDLREERDRLGNQAALQQSLCVEKTEELLQEKKNNKFLEEEIEKLRATVHKLCDALKEVRRDSRTRYPGTERPEFIQSIQNKLERAGNRERNLAFQLEKEIKSRMELQCQLQTLRRSFHMVNLPEIEKDVTTPETKSVKEKKNMDQLKEKKFKTRTAGGSVTSKKHKK